MVRSRDFSRCAFGGTPWLERSGAASQEVLLLRLSLRKPSGGKASAAPRWLCFRLRWLGIAVFLRLYQQLCCVRRLYGFRRYCLFLCCILGSREWGKEVLIQWKGCQHFENVCPPCCARAGHMKVSLGDCVAALLMSNNPFLRHSPCLIGHSDNSCEWC